MVYICPCKIPQYTRFKVNPASSLDYPSGNFNFKSRLDSPPVLLAHVDPSRDFIGAVSRLRIHRVRVPRFRRLKRNSIISVPIHGITSTCNRAMNFLVAVTGDKSPRGALPCTFFNAVVFVPFGPERRDEGEDSRRKMDRRRRDRERGRKTKKRRDVCAYAPSL